MTPTLPAELEPTQSGPESQPLPLPPNGNGRFNRKDLLKYRIAAAIGETSDFTGALVVALEHVCEETGWIFGEAWVPNEGSDCLECSAAWHSQRSGFEPLRAAAEGFCFHRGEELPGRAWQERGSIFIADISADSGFRRREEAGALGVKAGVAFPIFVNDKPVAILEFFMVEPRSDDARLVALIAEVSVYLGAVLQRKELEERVRKHEAALSRLNATKDHFMATLAHELRNPLTPMLHAVELLRSPEPADALDVIERQVKHLARLVDDLLEISRAAKGKMTLRMMRIDLVPCVRAATRTAQSAIAARRHLLLMALPEEPLWVEADPVRIEQVVGNLLTNAAKYTIPADSGKKIWLTLQKEEGEAILRVRDEGIGIPAEMLEYVFEPFVQLDEALVHTQGGLGIGLSLVRELVRMHGGQVTVLSQGRGKGSEFQVRLPLVEAPESPSAVEFEKPPPCAFPIAVPGAPAKAAKSPPPAARRRVLVVEDDADLAYTLARLLRVWGHDTEVTGSGAGALKKAAEFLPEIVLVDLDLGGQDGCEVAKQLLAQPQNRDLRIIAITGSAYDADRARAMAAGCDGYLVKPMNPALIREMLAS